MREEIAVQSLREVKEVFDKAGIKFWLDHGTLLGAVRDGKIIEWDTDIDLGAAYDNIDKIISVFPELEKRGFNVFLDFCYDKHSVLHITRFDCNASVLLFRVIDDNAWAIDLTGENLITKFLIPNLIIMLSQRAYAKPQGIFVGKVLKYYLSLLPPALKRYFCDMAWSVWERCGGKYAAIAVPKRYVEKLETIEFYGMKFNIPSEAEKYLEYIYGTNWRIPKKEWDTPKNDGSFIYPVEVGRFVKS